jgi:hypothetical protein
MPLTSDTNPTDWGHWLDYRLQQADRPGEA